MSAAPGLQDFGELKLPGRLLDPERESENIQRLTEKVRELCGWRMRNFPGSQPVSLAKNNVTLLGRSHYVACEKSDGVRYLMLAASRKVYLIDRMETIQELYMFLPNFLGSDESHQLTLLDGEMVTDTYQEWIEDPNDPTNKIEKEVKSTRFLIYDAMVVHRDVNVSRMPLLERLKQVYDRVILPRVHWESENPDLVLREKQENQYLPLYLKDFFEIWDIGAIVQFATKRLPHMTDGIIFTPVYAPYVPGTCHGLLKWKPPNMNTVDFRAEMVKLNPKEVSEYNSMNSETPIDPTMPFAVKLLVGEGGVARWQGNIWCAPVGEFYKSMIEKYVMDGIDGAIYECMYDVDIYTLKPQLKWNDETSAVTYSWKEGTKDRGGWVVERVRTDRKIPNDKRVVKSVFKSIQDGISFLDLIEYIEGIRNAGKSSLSSRINCPEYYLKYGSIHSRNDAYNAKATVAEGNADNEDTIEEGNEDYKNKRLVTSDERIGHDIEEENIKKLKVK